MDAFLIYSLKLAVFLTVLYICVKAFLSRETFFSFNRWVLLLGVGVCLLLPLLNVTVSEKLAALLPSSLVEKYVAEEVQEEAITDTYVYSETIGTDYIADTGYVAETSSVDISLSQVLLIVYLVGLFVNLFLLGRSAYQMFRLIRTNPKQDYKGYKLVLVKDRIVPFSWGQYIVISISDFNDSPDEILTHEIAHIEHRHSLDIIFMECVLLLQWFNPAAWLLKRELKDMHEYQADMSVLESGIDTTKYQLLLVKKAVGASSYTLANSFNHSKIKKRITMMLKEKSSKWARLKLLLLLPLGTLTVFAFARPETGNIEDSFSTDEVTKNISNETSYGDIVHTYIDGKLVATHSLDKDVVGKASLGKFNLIHTTNAQNLATTIYPHEFSLKANPEESDYSKIKVYVSGGKKYTDKEFLNKYQGYTSFLERTKAIERNRNIVEVYGELANGLKTPIFYMVKANTDLVLGKDNSEKEIAFTALSGNKGEPLSFYPRSYCEVVIGGENKHDDMAKYVVRGKEYSHTEFRELVKGKSFVENKEDIKSGETDVLEFYCITKTGIKTPTWYMMKIKEGTTWKDLENEYVSINQKKKQDNPRKQVVVYSRIGEEGEILFSYPTAYDEAKEGEKPIVDDFVKYMTGGKEYTRKGFEELVKGKEFFKNKSDIESGITDIIEFHCITQKGLKTPTWYMVKIGEGKNWRDALKEGKSSTIELTPPPITKDK